MMGWRYFRPEVEIALKLLTGVLLLSLLVLPLAWGYEQRRQARAWKEIACAYRLAETARRATFLAIDDARAGACGRLRDLGLATDLAGTTPTRLASRQIVR
jgi:hypothetical protein